MTVAATAYTFEVEAEDGSLVEVQISSSEIREAGWIRESEADDYATQCMAEHCGDDDCECEQAGPVVEILTNWHNEHHFGVFRFCDAEPCRLVRKVVG